MRLDRLNRLSLLDALRRRVLHGDALRLGFSPLSLSSALQNTLIHKGFIIIVSLSYCITNEELAQR